MRLGPKTRPSGSIQVCILNDIIKDTTLKLVKISTTDVNLHNSHYSVHIGIAINCMSIIRRVLRRHYSKIL